MAERKRIGVILGNPEAIYQQRVLGGVFSQCAKCDCDAVVFSSLVQACHFDGEYLNAELNIFNLINFDMLDGIIVVPLSLSDDQVEWIREKVLATLKDKCRKPVATLDFPLGDYPVFYTDDRGAFSKITAHILDVHGCKRVYFLTGQKDFKVSVQRLSGFTDELERRGLPVKQEDIFYGDFWYTGGERLADKIAFGEVEMPDAVICASDHMALGLANRLIEHGISVPEKIIVTGYDATSEAAVNTPAITSYIPDISKAAAEAVNYILEKSDPNAHTVDAESSAENGMRLCASCGCTEDYGYIKMRLRNSLFSVNHNFGEKDIFDNVDISRLLDSYMFEKFTNAASVERCFKEMVHNTYLLRPYSDFYLCLKENWLDTDDCTVNGYPQKMNNVIHTQPLVEYIDHLVNCDEYHFTTGSEHLFDTSLMLPELKEVREKPCAFYFVPVHFNNDTLGYAVLQCDVTQSHKIDYVFHNWIRNVNNALEMVRIQNKLTEYSEHDVMTGLFNRRGMTSHISELTENAAENDVCVAFVIDVDGLKYINDNFGHYEGDFAIKEVSSAANHICRKGEICIRAGGDEFYIIGVGKYTEDDINTRIADFEETLRSMNAMLSKPYEISASIGSGAENAAVENCADSAIKIADANMYKNKCERKKLRKS